MSAIHAIVLAIKVAPDDRHPPAPTVSRISAAGVHIDSANGEYVPPHCLYTTAVDHGQTRYNREMPTLPGAIDTLCHAARSFRPNLVVAHDASFLARHVPGLYLRLVPEDPRPACTLRLARQLWPEATSFHAAHLCYWRELIHDEAHHHPDFPPPVDPYWRDATWRGWHAAACSAALFSDIRRSMAAAGQEATPQVLRELTDIPLLRRVPFGTYAGRLWSDVPLEHCERLLQAHRDSLGRQLDLAIAATLEAAVCGIYATAPGADVPDGHRGTAPFVDEAGST